MSIARLYLIEGDLDHRVRDDRPGRRGSSLFSRARPLAQNYVHGCERGHARERLLAARGSGSFGRGPRHVGISYQSGPRDAVVEVPSVSAQQHADLDNPNRSDEKSRRSDKSPPKVGILAVVTDE